MLILLDCWPAKLEEHTARYGLEFGQLRTPLTKYARARKGRWALDNGCFHRFVKEVWFRMLDEADIDRPLFVTLPDIPGDAQRTAELFAAFRTRTQELPRALVLQDGIERVAIPWDDIVAVFIGGTDRFKYSREAVNAARTARMLGKWVHVGRCNTFARLMFWRDLADSCDGSGVVRFSREMLQDMIDAITKPSPQQGLLEE